MESEVVTSIAMLPFDKSDTSTSYVQDPVFSTKALHAAYLTVAPLHHCRFVWIIRCQAFLVP